MSFINYRRILVIVKGKKNWTGDRTCETVGSDIYSQDRWITCCLVPFLEGFKCAWCGR